MLLQAQRKTVFLLVFVKRYETLFCFLKIVFFLVFVKIYKRCFVFSKLCFCLCFSLLFFSREEEKTFCCFVFSKIYNPLSVLRRWCYNAQLLSCSVVRPLLSHCGQFLAPFAIMPYLSLRIRNNIVPLFIWCVTRYDTVTQLLVG